MNGNYIRPYWESSGACYLGGNDDNGQNDIYTWNHDCGTDVTFGSAYTHGNGCDYEQYKNGALQIWKRSAA